MITNFNEGDLRLDERSGAVFPNPRATVVNSFESGGASNAALNFDLDADHRRREFTFV